MTLSFYTLRSLLVGLTLAAALPALALPTDYYAPHSALASGRWVKIKVDETSIHQITAEQLAEMGFSDIDRVAVHGFSALEIADHALTTAKPDDLPQLPAIVRDGKLIFYAEAGRRNGTGFSSSGRLVPATVQNPSSTAGYYFLTETDAPRRLEIPATEESDAAPITSGTALLMHKYLDSSPTKSGTHRLSDDVVKLSDRKLTHTFSVVKPVVGTYPTYHINYTTYSASSNGKISVYYPGSVLSYSHTNIVPVFFLRSFTNTATITPLTEDATPSMSIAVRNDNVNYAGVDFFAMLYSRHLEFADGEAHFSVYSTSALSTGQPLAFTDVDADNLEVWDISSASSPRRLKVVAATDADGAPAAALVDRNHESSTLTRFLAFKPGSRLPEVEFAGTVENTDLHSLDTPEMIIVTNRRLAEKAEVMAALHRSSDGLDVEVALIDDIYNEFSSGTPSADAIRRFAKMLYDRDPQRLRHILLMGIGNSNMRGFGASFIPEPDSYLPTFPTEEIANQLIDSRTYSTDAFYGTLSDGTHSSMTSPMLVNVGRIAALDPSEVEVYIRKVRRYLTTPPPVNTRSRAMVIADRGNNSGHVLQASEVTDIITAASPSTFVSRSFDPIFPYVNNQPVQQRKQIADELRRGVCFMSYCGHGNPHMIGSATLWSRSHVIATQFDHPPFLMLATCETYPFDSFTNNLGNNFLFNEHGGAIALVATGGKVQMGSNHGLHKAIASEYFAPTGGRTLGDVYRAAFNSIRNTGNEQLNVNTLCYNFGGDPSLPLYVHTHDITVADGTPSAFAASGSHNTLSGSITDSKGTVDTKFDGTLTATLYAPDVARTLYQHNSTDTLRSLVDYGSVVATKLVPVAGGRFDFNIDIPANAAPADGYRLHLSAVSRTSHDCAALALANLAVTPPDPADQPSSLPPAIDQFAAVDSLHATDILCGPVTFEATINTPRSLSHSGIAATSYLEYEGRRHPIASDITLNPDGTLRLSHSAAALAPGQYSATLCVVDTEGLSDVATTEFEVVESVATPRLEADVATARTAVTIMLSDFPSLPAEGRLAFIDPSGKTVRTVVNPSFPYTWDLTDSDGNPAPDGLFSARAWLRNDRGAFPEIAPTEFVIIKPLHQ